MTARLIWSALLLVACDPFSTEFDDVEPARTYRAADPGEAPAAPERLLVMSWNVKFGGGRIDFFFDCYGDRVLMERREVVDNLEAIAEYVRRVDPDVLLLQEVDVGSKRSAFVDQVQWLLDHTELRHGVYASQWRADYVPSDGIGAVDSGNAILSRWPLRDAQRLALPLLDEQDALTRYFYLRRNVLRARLDLPDRDDPWIVATHTDAYGKDGTKKKHIDRFTEVMDELSMHGTVIGGGDLNTIPPGSEQVMGFPDAVCEDEDFVADDYSAEAGWLDALYGRYEPAVTLDDYAADNARYFTHTVDGRGFWNRKLDYLFTNATWEPGSGTAHQDEAIVGLPTMPLSDHAPLTGVLVLP